MRSQEDLGSRTRLVSSAVQSPKLAFVWHPAAVWVDWKLDCGGLDEVVQAADHAAGTQMHAPADLSLPKSL